MGGLAFPTINVAFGRLLDSTASVSNVQAETRKAVLFMVGPGTACSRHVM